MTRAALLLASTAFALPAFAQDPVPQGTENVPEFEPAFPEQTDAPQMVTDVALMTEEIAGGLVHPWAIEILPDGEGYLVTERTGQLRHITLDGIVSEPITGVPTVFAVRQGGLLDVALAPDFAESRVIYLTYSRPFEGDQSATAAARAVLSEDLSALTEVEDIWVQQPPSPTPMHYGSRVVPGPDGMIYITTGEHSSPAERTLAQELAATYGKVIRVMPDGSVPEDNPFVDTDGADDTIWSLGHRNMQGAAFRPATGQFWVIEHGPAGGDELNLIEAGANYGWPVVSYGENYSGTPIGTGEETHAPDFTEPTYYWDPVIAPGGMVFYEGDVFPEWEDDALIGGLVAGGLVRVDLDGDIVIGEERILPGLGRVRDVAIDADGTILVVTDFEDGALIRISPEG